MTINIINKPYSNQKNATDISNSGRDWLITIITLVTLFLCPTIPLRAQQSSTSEQQNSAATTPPTLPSVVVTGRHYNNAIGSSDAASQGEIQSALIDNRSLLRPAEVLEFVPGLIVTQHSGDGKANQYFLRGFNLDHGTDFATSVDGIPVNMPSHGHGQGYSDLNFLIPELVERIEYRKGPYFATHGDFASAGAADIVYKSRLEVPFAQITLGQNGYQRGLAASSFQLRDDLVLLGGLEWMSNDGPWSVPENLQRKNGVLRLTQGNSQHGSSVSLMAYDAHWVATDQIPQRLIDAGSYNGKLFDRFDSLDPTDGGNTSRYSANAEWHRRDQDTETHIVAYAVKYALKLFSNFTYLLERPLSGDQFSQQDDRKIFGAKISRAWAHQLGTLDAHTEIGIQLRNDRIRVGLFDTQARQISATTREDNIREILFGIYGQSTIQLNTWLRSIVGLRADSAHFSVDSLLHPANSGNARDSLLSPKFTLVAGPWKQTEFFFNAGSGFHSNDARGTTAKIDPRTGERVDPVPGLVPASGWELGIRTEQITNLQSSLAFWQLNSDSELVYIGDAGTTEASAASKRRGIEFNNRWTPNQHFSLDADIALSRARFANGDRIPNAVDSVASIAVTLQDIGAWTSSLQWRYLGSGALIEDNSIRSTPASTFNFKITRKLSDITGQPASVTLDMFNIFNRKVNDIQYYYASQLAGESTPVNDRIIHPGEPRTVRITYRMSF